MGALGVSVPTENRTLLAAASEVLDSHKVSPEITRECIALLRSLATNKSGHVDSRTQLMATAKLLDHGWSVFEHENPPVQKVDLTSGGDKITGFEVVFINKTDTTAVTRPPTDGAPQ